MLPQAVVTVVMMPIAGRLYDRIGARWPTVVGLALDGAGTLLMTGINADMTRTELAWWMMIRAAGIGLAMMPIITSGISSLPGRALGSGSAFNALIQRVSSSLGLAALTALATAQQAQYLADRAALEPTLGADAAANLDPLGSSPSGVSCGCRYKRRHTATRFCSPASPPWPASDSPRSCATADRPPPARPNRGGGLTPVPTAVRPRPHRRPTPGTPLRSRGPVPTPGAGAAAPGWAEAVRGRAFRRAVAIVTAATTTKS